MLVNHINGFRFLALVTHFAYKTTVFCAPLNPPMKKYQNFPKNLIFIKETDENRELRVG
jgi:hypothetical protein